MDHKTVEEYLLNLPGAYRDYPFGEGVAVYKIGGPDGPTDEDKMFALITEASTPLQLSLKCDPQLSVLLREKYETVMAGHHLNKKHWNTLLLTGQLGWLEVQDLIRLSYNLVSGAA